MDSQTKVTGVILAGGRARRMNNRDKGLVLFKGQPMVSYAIEAMKTVADETIINANRNISGYRALGLTVISDQTDSFDGPLAGILAAMIFAKHGLLLVMPCDSPLIKAHHLQKILSVRAENDADIAVAFDGVRVHPVFLAIKVSLQEHLQDYLNSGQRKLHTWLEQHKMIKVDFSTEPYIFTNINTLPELKNLEQCIETVRLKGR
ncbi:MAG: molybdenum cofactor guanylyltransferase MobA [Methyloglobulus sp.]|nr:molybdenum cofactor guanylyltransferase [Methyloglobulus sp.]